MTPSSSCVWGWYYHPQSRVSFCVPHFRPSRSMVLSLFCSLVLSSPRSKAGGDFRGGSEPLGPQLHPCLTLAPTSSLLDLGEMPPVTLTAPLTRWVLFEEKLEVGAGRWSAPHVPTVALPSLRSSMACWPKGLVLLDCPALSLRSLQVPWDPFPLGGPGHPHVSLRFLQC